MKYIFMAAAAALVFTGCYTRPDHMGRPGEDTYMEIGPNDRTTESKSADNIRDVGRQNSPSSPFTGQGNGTLNF